jgi:glutathione S-transferase
LPIFLNFLPTGNFNMKLYTFTLSGHAHRAELALSLMGIPAELLTVDLPKGAHKHPEFLAMNPFGQVPVLEDDGVFVPDSNAILVYLARKHGKTDWLPSDPLGEASVQRWLSVAAGLVAFGPAAARLITVFGAPFQADEVIARANQLLGVMNTELAQRTYLVGNQPTIADIANYSYIAHAPEGNVSLDPYPNVKAWLARIEALPGFAAMPASAVGLCAA